jgi:hypothetical protein
MGNCWINKREIQSEKIFVEEPEYYKYVVIRVDNKKYIVNTSNLLDLSLPEVVRQDSVIIRKN